MIDKLLEEKMGFITSPEELKAVIEENRMIQILVRCGGGRFVCPAQDVQHFMDIVNKEGSDYIRDISILRK